MKRWQPPVSARAALGISAMVAVLLCCQMAGLAGYALIFPPVDRPIPWLAHLTVSFFGFAAFIGLAALGSFWISHSAFWKKQNSARWGLLEETLEALSQIARGNFTVRVSAHENEPFAELAASVNKMARELGSMENLRQDFISNVSHEIQSPLTSIGGFAALLRDGALTPGQRAHYIDIIEAESKRLSKLSDNLLRLSALEGDAAVSRRAYRLDKQLEHIALLLEPQWMEKNISVEAELQKITYAGDEDLLSQVWVNLLHNAVKFTPPGGSVGIALSLDGDSAVCRISDTGAGIAPEDKAHIFERFYKADKSRDRSLGGSGLGLSLVKKAVELHGGLVSAESELDKGSVFTVTLPMTLPLS